MPLRSEELAERLRALASAQGIPGIVAGVLDHGRVVTAGTGVLDVTEAMPATPRTPFPIASITKVWTATLVMKLADEGLVDVDDPVVAQLPGLTTTPEHPLRTVTVRQLLSHSSGLEGDHFVDTGSGDDALEKYAACSADLRMLHQPGVAASYCNTGMILLGCLVEHVTEQFWSAAVGKTLFAPLGLTQTTATPPAPGPDKLCVGHEGERENRRVVREQRWPRAAGPAGMFWSTPSDLLKFVGHHLAATKGGGIELGLSRESARLMQVPHASLPGPSWLLAPDHWGLGWSLFDWGGGRVIGHDGGAPGFSSFLRVVPDAGVAVTVLANVGDSGPAIAGMVGDILAEMTGVRPPAPLGPPAEVTGVDVSSVVGRYVGSSVEYVVSRATDGLMLASRPLAGQSTLGISDMVNLRPLDSSGMNFVLEPTPEFDIWMPVTLAPLADGTRAIHLAGRVAVRDRD